MFSNMICFVKMRFENKLLAGLDLAHRVLLIHTRQVLHPDGLDIIIQTDHVPIRLGKMFHESKLIFAVTCLRIFETLIKLFKLLLQI